MNLIQTLEQEEIARLGKTIPDFAPGDTVIVRVSVEHSWITPVGGMVDPGGRTLTKTAEMRIE